MFNYTAIQQVNSDQSAAKTFNVEKVDMVYLVYSFSVSVLCQTFMIEKCRMTNATNKLETKASSHAGQCIPAGSSVSPPRRVLRTVSIITMRTA